MVSYTVKFSAVISQVVLTSSIALLTHATKKGGQYNYSTITVQMFSEVRSARNLKSQLTTERKDVVQLT
eukprot:3348477-Pyramimonas_sp.AAC.1